mgnify:CR=1 FL=1|tara:strand:- start:47 stop:220 length:174 start_codon:yes stop_codon:yes gene_type:complete
MKDILKRIHDRLNELYPDKDMCVCIYTDNSWALEENMSTQNHGDTIEELQELLGIDI